MAFRQQTCGLSIFVATCLSRLTGNIYGSASPRASGFCTQRIIRLSNMKPRAASGVLQSTTGWLRQARVTAKLMVGSDPIGMAKPVALQNMNIAMAAKTGLKPMPPNAKLCGRRLACLTKAHSPNSGLKAVMPWLFSTAFAQTTLMLRRASWSIPNG